jgi:hypothetical protein
VLNNLESVTHEQQVHADSESSHRASTMLDGPRARRGTPPAGRSQTSLTAQRPLTAAPRRTEAEALAAAERNRRERQRQLTGTPVELISSYVKANILRCRRQRDMDLGRFGE